MQKQINLETHMLDTHEIEYLVCHVGLLWRRLLNAKIKSLGISGTEKRVLFCIARNPGLTQIQIANLLDIEPQNLMRSLDKLEKQNWIQKEVCKKDRRIKQLYVTPLSKKILKQIQNISDDLKPQVLLGIDEKKLEIVGKNLKIMRENILKQLGDDEK